jgi:hypothetical protein
MKKLIFALVGIMFVASLCAGCHSYRIGRFQDHYSKPVTIMEVDKTSNYLFTKKFTHQFYLCKDEPEALVCSIVCDGANDIKCPRVQVMGNYVMTNVR